MKVKWLAEADREYQPLPARERRAMDNAVLKLDAAGDRLGFPHSSAVKAARANLRELRPQAGRSPWRAFYRRVGDQLVIAAVGPEAEADSRGFDRSVKAALERLTGYEG